MAKRNMKTPDERAEAVEKAEKRARRGYRNNIDKNRKLSDAELDFIRDSCVILMLVGYSNMQIAHIVGLSKSQVKIVREDANVQKRIASLKSKLPEAALTLGKAYLVEAIQAVVHVMRTEKDNALVLKAAAEIFDRFGIPKVSRAEGKIETQPPATEGEISDDLMTKLRAAPPEVQEKVAALHESFTEGIDRILREGSENAEPVES